jgi:cation diffusion facilitator family transporter
MQSGQRIAVIGMAVSAGLAALKITTGLMGNSNSLLADGYESAGDVLASGMVFVGLRLAAKPADSNHPYGHGRAEILSGLALGMLLFVAGVAIAVDALLGARDITEYPKLFTIYPLIFSTIVKLWMMRVKYQQGRRMGSASLVADAYNDGIDTLSGIAALVAVSLTLSNPERYPLADHYGAFIIGIIMMFTGARVARDTGLQLMDTMPDQSLLDRVRDVALQVDGVRGVEKCFARKTGLRYHVDLHLEVDPHATVLEGHDIASRARDEIKARLNWVADVLVHVEPANLSDMTQADITKKMNKLFDLVLDPSTSTLTHEPFGDHHLYFDGPTGELSKMVAGSLRLAPGMSPHPPHQHPEEEFLLVTEGAGEILCAGKTTAVGPGSMMYCESNALHGIENTGPTPMLFYYYKWLA